MLYLRNTSLLMTARAMAVERMDIAAESSFESRLRAGNAQARNAYRETTGRNRFSYCNSWIIITLFRDSIALNTSGFRGYVYITQPLDHFNPA